MMEFLCSQYYYFDLGNIIMAYLHWPARGREQHQTEIGKEWVLNLV